MTLYREVGGPPVRRRIARVSWLAITAMVAFALTVGVFALGGRIQRAGLPVHSSTAR